MNISEQRQALREGLARKLHNKSVPGFGETLEAWYPFEDISHRRQGYYYAKADTILAYLHSRRLQFPDGTPLILDQ